MSSSLNQPTRSPSFDRAMVVILSTIKRLGSPIAVSSSAATSNRNSGASVGSVVNAHVTVATCHLPPIDTPANCPEAPGR